MAIDATRPNLDEGATPERLEPADYPLYRTRKTCRLCKRDYVGLSLMPQYDDDPRFFGWCGRCPAPASPALGKWPEPHSGKTPKRFTKAAPARRDVWGED